MRQGTTLLVGLVGLTSCDAEPTQDTADATAATFAEGSRAARAAVAFLNDPTSGQPQLNAAGLNATIVRVIIDHPRPDDLELTLENTHGTVVPPWDPSMGPLPTAPEGIVVGVSGDESANGLWTITARDTVACETGALSLFALELISRCD